MPYWKTTLGKIYEKSLGKAHILGTANCQTSCGLPLRACRASVLSDHLF